MARISRAGIALVLLAGSACTSSVIEEFAGQVLDKSSGKPIAGITAAAGAEKVVTGVDGRFVLQNVKLGTEIALSGCAYEPTALAVHEDATGSVSVKMSPLLVQGRVISNLTAKGLPAEVTGESSFLDGPVTTKASAKGQFSLSGTCEADSLRVSMKGYEAARAPVNFGTPLDITLLADPGTTFEQLGDWEANLRFEKSWEWAHPDTHVYLTKAQFLRAWRDDLQQGYQLQRVDVKSYKILRAWTHTKCEVADFGPKKYQRVAAVQARTVYSAPEGGIERQEGISHWVQTKDGRWRWFPQANCRYLV